MQLCWYLIKNKQDNRLNKHKNMKKSHIIITTDFNSKAFIEKLTHRHKVNILTITFVVDNAANILSMTNPYLNT